MKADSMLQKLEGYLVVAVAVVLVSSLAFALSGTFSPEDYGVATAQKASVKASAAPSLESTPAVLEPALRSLDGISYHG